MVSWSAPRPKEGEFWKDRDPRGGSTFVVVHVDPPHVNGFATVEGMDGKRRRRIRLNRFGSYELLRAAPPVPEA